MPNPSPQEPNDVRLRRLLDATLQLPVWPAGFSMRTFTPDDAPTLHGLLTLVFDDGSDGPFDVWWPRVRDDADFDPNLCFLVFDQEGDLAGGALCWISAFVKDLAVLPAMRGKGIAEALMWHSFRTFRDRGSRQVDLKTNLVENADAVRLYRRLGMFEVDWAG